MKGEPEEPLPATLAFVMTMGGTFVVAWFAMFALLSLRW